MQIHQIKPINVPKKRKIVGRGGKKGTYSGRGGKGQTARAGRKLSPIIREFIKRYPKLKGYRALALKPNLAIINLDVLNKNFKDGQIINPENLIDAGLVNRIKGNIPKIKILGRGKLAKKLIFEGCIFSKTALQAIEKAGGIIKK